MYPIGAPIRLRDTFTDLGLNAAIDPDTVTVTITAPDGTETAGLPAVRDAIGQYHYDLTPAVAGRYQFQFIGTGPGGSVRPEDIVNVEAAVSRAMISLADARAAISSTSSGTLNDDDLRLYLAAVTEVIEDICGPVVPAARTVTRDGGGRALLLPETAVTVNSVTVAGQLVDPALYTVDLPAGIIYAGGGASAPGRWTAGTHNVVVTYTVGMTIIPPNLRLAAREELRFLWQVGKQGPRPTFGAGPETTMTGAGFAVPNRVIELCAGYLRPPVLA